jgi:hypothetical protein
MSQVQRVAQPLIAGNAREHCPAGARGLGGRRGPGVVLARFGSGVAGRVVAELGQHPSAESAAEPGLAQQDLSGRLLAKRRLQLPFQSAGLGDGGREHRDVGGHARAECLGDQRRLFQLRRAEGRRRRPPRSARAVRRRRRCLSAACGAPSADRSRRGSRCRDEPRLSRPPQTAPAGPPFTRPASSSPRKGPRRANGSVLIDLVEARHPTSRPAFAAADGRQALTLDLEPRICV